MPATPEIYESFKLCCSRGTRPVSGAKAEESGHFVVFSADRGTCDPHPRSPLYIRSRRCQNRTVRSLVLLVLFAAVCPVAAAPAPSSVIVHAAAMEHEITFTPALATNKFLADFMRWAGEDAGNLPRRDSVLAVGSSSMRLWKTIRADLAPLDIIHRGFGGSTMEQVLEMMFFFQRYQAGSVLVYQGDNDFMNPDLTPEEYAGQCKEFIKGIRANRPDAKIFFISTKPCPARVQNMPRIAEANALVKRVCESDGNLGFIDVFTPMLGLDGKPRPELFIADGTHLSEKGYALWKDVVRGKLMAESSE